MPGFYCDDGFHYILTAPLDTIREYICADCASCENCTGDYPDIIEAKAIRTFDMIGLIMDLPLACMIDECGVSSSAWLANKYSTSV